MEAYGRLQAMQNGPAVYARLCELFREADDRYNSGLFHFLTEKGRKEPADEWTLRLQIDDAVLKDIIRRLYYPDSPYEFSVIGADILGQVYEQFLGKVIRLTTGHQAKVEEKPEVRKSGGVYYTPTYIVDYIVQNTVGKLLEGKTPKQIRGTKKQPPLSVLDPACGSGSFLIGAYQHLLDWYLGWYCQHTPGKHRNAVYQPKKGQWRLTTAERKRILVDHIFGVDIDPQAVEVTKLSLLLKVLEGETKETLQRQLFAKQRALPDLAGNIKCGNSLIGPDGDEKRQLDLFDEEKRLRINAFDWNAEFSERMKAGGFDALIGNPPYVDVKILGNEIKELLAARYLSATRRFDLYLPFVERGIDLIASKGLLGYILPSMFTRRDYGRDLRGVITRKGRVEHFVDFGSNQVFDGPMNYVAVLVLSRQQARDSVPVIRCVASDLTRKNLEECLRSPVVGVERLSLPALTFSTTDEWYLQSLSERKLMDRLLDKHDRLDRVVRCASEGIHSGKDEVFFLPREVAVELGLESPPVFPLAKGKDVHRYEYLDVELLPNVVVYPYDLDSGGVLSAAHLSRKFPRTWQYLQDCRGKLKGREYFEQSKKEWYELWCPRSPDLYTSEKIVGPEIACRGEFTLISESLFVNNKLKVVIPRDEFTEGAAYLLGCLNSSLLVYLHRKIAPPKGGGFFEVKTQVMARLPIRRIDYANAKDVAWCSRVIELVNGILELKKQSKNTKDSHGRTSIDRQIAISDAAINKLVFALYGLTKNEIHIVEEATKSPVE